MTTGSPQAIPGRVAQVWDVESGKPLGDLVVRDDGDWAGAGGVWPIDGGRKLLTVSSIVASGRKAVTIVWDATTLKELERHVHDLPLTEVLDYSPAADRVFGRRHSDPANESRGPGDTLCVFDRKTGKEVWSRAHTEDLNRLRATIKPDGSGLAICHDQKLELIELATGKGRALKANPSYWGSKPVFSADGNPALRQPPGCTVRRAVRRRAAEGGGRVARLQVPPPAGPGTWSASMATM